MDIEFIKWKVGYAEGFELNEDQLIFPEGGVETLTEDLLKLRVWKLVWNPLLLQKAIEGINDKGDYIIEQTEQGCFLLSSSEDFGADTYDGSKDKVLKYIYEQEATYDNN